MMHQSDSYSDQAAAGLGSKLLMTLALGLLLVAGWRCTSATHARRGGNKPKKLPHRLQTWEGEGGRPFDANDQAPGLHPEPLPHVTGSQSLQH